MNSWYEECVIALVRIEAKLLGYFSDMEGGAGLALEGETTLDEDLRSVTTALDNLSEKNEGCREYIAMARRKEKYGL